MQEIIKADVLGFCFGVRRAVELAQKALDERDGTYKKVYSLGPLIHNEAVLNKLSQQGLIILEDDSIENISSIEKQSLVIIRAHGVTPYVIDELIKKDCRIVDATCPRVKASQKTVEKYTSQNDYVILTGDKNHGEVIGIAGYAGSNFIQIQTKAEAENLDTSLLENGNVILLSQTTFSAGEFSAIENVLKNKINNIIVMNTICPATHERQKALVDLCKKVDGVLVIGGKDSSNTKRLYQTALQNCTYAAHIQTKEDIPIEFFKLKSVGITAGASTPDEIIEEIKETFNK